MPTTQPVPIIGDMVTFRRDQIRHIEKGRVVGVIFCNRGIEVEAEDGDRLTIGHKGYEIIE